MPKRKTYRIEIEADTKDTTSSPGFTRLLLNGVEVLLIVTSHLKSGPTLISEATPTQKAETKASYQRLKQRNTALIPPPLDRSSS
jgi:hypothetical protein